VVSVESLGHGRGALGDEGTDLGQAGVTVDAAVAVLVQRVERRAGIVGGVAQGVAQTGELLPVEVAVAVVSASSRRSPCGP